MPRGIWQVSLPSRGTQNVSATTPLRDIALRVRVDSIHDLASSATSAAFTGAEIADQETWRELNEVIGAELSSLPSESFVVFGRISIALGLLPPQLVHAQWRPAVYYWKVLTPEGRSQIVSHATPLDSFEGYVRIRSVLGSSEPARAGVLVEWLGSVVVDPQTWVVMNNYLIAKYERENPEPRVSVVELGVLELESDTEKE